MLKKYSKIELKDNKVIIICAVGGRSKYISNIIKKINKESIIFNVEKGIMSWIKNNNPIVKYY